MPLPRSKLLPFIDGRAAKRAHGTREMPVWGKVLHQDQAGSTEREMMVRGTILVILDYLETVQWDKRPPAPMLPGEIVAKTMEKYLEAYERLVGRPLDPGPAQAR